MADSFAVSRGWPDGRTLLAMQTAARAWWPGGNTVVQVLNSPAARWALLGVASLLGALIVSYLVPPIVALLREARAALAILRRQLGAWADRVTGGRWEAFWAARGTEPREPVLAGLARIDRTAGTLGHEQIRTLEELDRRLTDQMRLLRAAAAPDPVPIVATRERITRSIAAAGLGLVTALIVMTLLFGLANAALLNIFFREMLGARPILPTFSEALQIGHFLAFLFFMGEVASGVLIYSFGPDDEEPLEGEPVRRRTGTDKFFQGVGWFLLAALASVELWAYATLSDRLNLPAQLRIAPDSPFYQFGRFFFAFFGVGLTGALSACGHKLSATFHRRARAKVERRLLRALERKDDTIVDHVERVRAGVVAINEAAGEMPTAVAQSFHDALGLSQLYPGSPSAVHAAAVQTLSSTEPPKATALMAPGLMPPGPPPARTRSQVLGDLAVDLLIMVVLCTMTALTLLEAFHWVAGPLTPMRSMMAISLGVALPTAAVGLGVLMRNALARLRYASVVERMLAEPRGRRTYGLILIGATGIVALLFALLTVDIPFLGSSMALDVLLGLAQAAVLVALGGFVDAGAVAIVHAGFLAWLASVRCVAVCGAGVARVISVCCIIAEYGARFLAIPGDVIRSAFGRSARAVPPLATPQR